MECEGWPLHVEEEAGGAGRGQGRKSMRVEGHHCTGRRRAVAPSAATSSILILASSSEAGSGVGGEGRTSSSFSSKSPITGPCAMVLRRLRCFLQLAGFIGATPSDTAPMCSMEVGPSLAESNKSLLGACGLSLTTTRSICDDLSPPMDSRRVRSAF